MVTPLLFSFALENKFESMPTTPPSLANTAHRSSIGFEKATFESP